MLKQSLLLLLFPLFLFAQVARFDDFNRAQPWWQFHREGIVSADSEAIQIKNGYLLLKLTNPSSSRECNIGISDAQNIYSKSIAFLAFEARIKILSPMKPGSRGWGFWKAAKGGRASSLAWFMQQFDAQNPAFSWSRMGVISRGKTAFCDVRLPQDEWHLYRVERDRTVGSTRFFVDGNEVYSTPGLAPAERMSFHLWIDNQVYSRKKGILRQQWTGVSSMLVDWVKIEDRPPAPVTEDVPGPVVLFERFRRPRQDGSFSIRFGSPGDTVYVLTAVQAEFNQPFEAADELTLDWNGRQTVCSGARLRGSTRYVLLTSAVGQGQQTLNFSVRQSPMLWYVAAFSYPGLRLLRDLEKNELPAGASDITFRVPHKKLLVCLAMKSTDGEAQFSVKIDGRNYGKEAFRPGPRVKTAGMEHLLFMETTVTPGLHRLQWVPGGAVQAERLILFSRP